MNDLFSPAKGYSAKDIEVLEGLEPVRRHPGMYIGGTDEAALHHLVAEVLDNAMDEAVAGQANRIDVVLGADGSVTVADNGRGIPVDPHPKFKKKSALEVILTTLHSGGKFGGRVYRTAGGLHGVGLSVVNALSDRLLVEVARDGKLWSQPYSRGVADGPLKSEGKAGKRRGTTVTFHPDARVFDKGARFRPATVYRMARSKAYLFRGVEIRWTCSSSLVGKGDPTPEQAILRFPGGLTDFLASTLEDREVVTPASFSGRADLNGESGRVEWGVAWPVDEDAFFRSYCNTISTPQGGTPRGGAARGPDQGIEGPRGARGRQAGGQADRRRRHRRGLRHVVGVHPRSPVPGPDQGETGHGCCHPAGGRRHRRPLRPLAFRRPGSRPGPHRARGGTRRRAFAKAPGTADQAGVRHPPPAPAGEARRLHQGQRRGHGTFPGRGRFRRRFGKAGQGPQDPGRAPLAG